MESLSKVRRLLVEIYKIFIPSSVELMFSEAGTEFSQKFETMSYKGARDIDRFFQGKLYNTQFKKISITTVPGTIREHSKSYPRKAHKTTEIFDMKIDLLPIHPKATELQQVTLSSKGIRRNGKNIKELPLDNIRKVWNENPECKGIEMPTSSSNFIRKV